MPQNNGTGPARSHPVETLTTDLADEALGEGIGPWCSDWGADDADTIGLEDLIEVGLELGVSVTYQESDGMDPILRCHGQVSHPLDHPGADRMSRDPGHVDPSGIELDEEQHVEALQQHRTDREEVAGQHGGCLGAEQLIPGRTITHRWRIDAVPMPDDPDARRSQNHAGPGQLGVDSAIAPGGVLSDQSEDDRYRAGGDARAPGRWG